MKNSSEWLSDIETKLKRRIELRNKRRKAVIRITGGIASCSALLLAIAVIPNVNELSINNKTDSDIISENNENHIPETTNNNETTKAGTTAAVSCKTEEKTKEISSITQKIKETTVTSVENSSENSTITDSEVTTENNNDNNTDPIDTDISTEEPKTEPQVTTPTSTEPPVVQSDFKINKIIFQISGAPKNYPPDMYDTIIWSYEELVEYYAVDFRNAFIENGFTADNWDEYSVIFDKNGNIAKDTVTSIYWDADGNSIRLSASRVSVPYDYIFQLESNETSNINGVEVLFGGMLKTADSDAYDSFCADFEKDGINYRITADSISDKQFYSIVESYILL